MNDWDTIKCNTDCGRCNHHGTPSVTKGSKYCLMLRREIPSTVETHSIFDTIFSLFNLKGKMRAFGKIKTKEVDKDEQT